MEIPKILSANIGRHDEIILYGLSDWHLGSEYCERKLLQGFIDNIRDTKNAYCLILGDVMDNALKNSKSNVYTATMNPHQQINEAANMLYPIKDKILAIRDGNHELRTIKEVGLLPMYVLTTKLAIGMSGKETDNFINSKYSIGAFTLFITYDNARNAERATTFSIYGKHGTGGGSTVGGKANAMEKMQRQVIADVYLSGHTHVKQAFAPDIYIADPLRKTVNCHNMLNVNTGMFLRWGGYAAEGSYAPSSTGTPKIRLWAERGRGKHDTQQFKHAIAEVGF